MCKKIAQFRQFFSCIIRKSFLLHRNQPELARRIIESLHKGSDSRNIMSLESTEHHQFTNILHSGHLIIFGHSEYRNPARIKHFRRHTADKILLLAIDSAGSHHHHHRQMLLAIVCNHLLGNTLEKKRRKTQVRQFASFLHLPHFALELLKLTRLYFKHVAILYYRRAVGH